jgi:hypothetical protein
MTLTDSTHYPVGVWPQSYYPTSWNGWRLECACGEAFEGLNQWRSLAVHLQEFAGHEVGTEPVTLSDRRVVRYVARCFTCTWWDNELTEDRAFANSLAEAHRQGSLERPDIWTFPEDDRTSRTR